MPADVPSRETTPWREGWDAAHVAAVGGENKSNPYPDGTPERDEWDDGFRAGWEDEYPEADNAE